MIDKTYYDPNKWELVDCILCKSNDFKEICSYDHIKIVKCKTCGLIYRNPRFKENLNREFYSYDYYGSYKDTEERVSLARGCLFRNALDRLHKKITSDSKKTLLDVGCGQGHFLKLAKDLSWEVEGVELSKAACEYAKEKFDIDIKNKDLREVNFPDCYFDTITLWNVLDHLLYPIDILREIYRVLKPEGILVIRVPNVKFHFFIHKLFSLFQVDTKSDGLRDPSIIVNFGFSKKTIKKVLKKVDFQKIKAFNSILSSGDPYRSMDVFSDRLVNLFKKAYWMFSQVIFYITFGKVLTGSSLLVYARKK